MNTYKAYKLRIYPIYLQRELILKFLSVLDMFIIIFGQKEKINMKKIKVMD